MTQRLTNLETTLENTLLNALYPGIKVAVVNVPNEPLDAYEELQVENAMANLKFKNTPYKLVGASGSSKDGKFYFVDKDHSQPIAERFQHWPQAAIVYFGILVSSCKVVIEEPDVSVLVVEDHVLGTNDCRGWIRRSLFSKLQLPDNCFYQFRLAFEKTQAKGSFKVMEDEAAQLLDADIVLPESAVKPGLKVPVAMYSVFGKGRRFRGPVVLGIREFSRKLEFESSYTLIEHAPDDSIQLEILPEALGQVRKLNDSISEGRYTELLQLLGLDDAEKSQDEEVRTVEAALLADTSGHIVRYPYINNQLNRLLARWAFKAATGGGFRLPAYALADDGYLVVHDGRLYAGSDWISKQQAIVALESKRGLCVRYPIRMCEDLLPMEHIGSSELIMQLNRSLNEQGCRSSYDLAGQIATQQLLLEGTYVLHSEAAKKNGGDFDFDWICILEENRFPRFVRKRFSLTNEFHQQKMKLRKAKSPWWNLEHVAIKARGNQIGMITDLKTSCLAAGRSDLAYQLVTELQKALDSLKHEVEPDAKVIADIRQQVNPAPWLKYKNESRISGLPIHLDVDENDRIGKLYNHVRKEIEDLLTAKLPIEEFKGLVSGEEVTRPMFDECRYVNSVYAAVVGRISERQDKLKADLDKAQAEWEAVRKGSDKELRKQKLQVRRKAYSAHYHGEERAKQEMKAIISYVRVWAASKTDNRMGWCQALNRVVCNGQGSGSILFHAFPQELVAKLAEQTGGKTVRVVVPEVSGMSIFRDSEGRSFLVEKIEGGEKQTFLFQYKDGQFFFG
ncbi:MAG: hypothetical protein LAO78_06375 [Acidobacteriia bacterium]|nr:hypothetical protein [Terriglobia bacterium]